MFALMGIVAVEDMEKKKPEWLFDFYFGATIVAANYISVEFIGGDWFFQLLLWSAYLISLGVSLEISKKTAKHLPDKSK